MNIQPITVNALAVRPEGAMTTGKLEKLYTKRELTEMGLGSKTKLDGLVRQGLLKKTKLGYATRFKESDVLAYLHNMENSNDTK